MSEEYISRQSVIDCLWENQDEYCSAIVGDIEDIPAGDVVLAKRGRWIKPVPGDKKPHCSECKHDAPSTSGFYPHYWYPSFCPFCGADMREKDVSQTSDVLPVIHAHVVVNWLGDCHCSNCGNFCDSAKPFCADCGARFDEPERREE